MSLLDKILRRDNSVESHDRWVEAHPGKGAMPAPPPAVDPAEERATRARMEAELDSQRAKRDIPS